MIKILYTVMRRQDPNRTLHYSLRYINFKALLHNSVIVVWLVFGGGGEERGKGKDVFGSAGFLAGWWF